MITMKQRLAVMMFLQYFVPGATVPILSYYLLGTLQFAPSQVGVILAMPAVAALVAPIVGSRIADRLISAERMLGVCHIGGSCVMYLLVLQDHFWPFLLLYLLYGLLFAPTFALTNAVALHHVKDAARDFGGVRVWGTIGWLAVAWTFGYFWLGGGDQSASRLSDALRLSAIASFVLGSYAFTIPRGHAPGAGEPKPSAWQALRLFKNRSLLFFAILTFLAAMVDRSYYFGVGPFLSSLGFPDHTIMPSMSLGQVTEVFIMAMLGRVFLPKIGVKRLLVAGMCVEVFRYTVFAVGGPLPLVVVALCTHGICYTFYFATAFIYFDRFCTRDLRAGAQQLFSVFITGGGVLGGNLLSGQLAEWLSDAQTGEINYTVFWAVLAGGGAVAALLLLMFFRERAATQPVP